MRRALLHAWLLIALLAPCAAALAQDSIISERVTSALVADPTLKNMRISVATRDGVVHLTGFVNSIEQLERAAALARAVEGVSAVRNTIRVANRPSRA